MTNQFVVTLDREIFWAQTRGGVSRYFVELAREFMQNPDFGVDMRLPQGLTINEHLSGLNPDRFPLARGPASALPRVPGATRITRWLGTRTPRNWRSSDIVHHTYYAPEVVAKTPGVSRVVTVHDMIHELLPESAWDAEQSTRKKCAIETADAIICISNATKADLVRLWGGRFHAPIFVVHHGVGAEFTADGPTLPSSLPYVLYVGTRNGYKDFGTFLRACSISDVRREGVGVLCVGGGPLTPAERHMILSLGLDGFVQHRVLSDSELACAYRGASAFVCPSRYEGFSLPVLESLACGCPTVVADTPALMEVGGSAVFSYLSGDADALATQLNWILSSSPSALGRRRVRGLERAAGFSWRTTARATAAVYEQVLLKGQNGG